jgi:hypothetical protein
MLADPFSQRLVDPVLPALTARLEVLAHIGIQLNRHGLLLRALVPGKTVTAVVVTYAPGVSQAHIIMPAWTFRSCLGLIPGVQQALAFLRHHMLGPCVRLCHTVVGHGYTGSMLGLRYGYGAAA